MHAAIFDAVEYMPTAHLVQMLAPVPAPVFVIEPSGHTAQLLALTEPVEYLPTAHGAHLVAPAAPPVSVVEPAWQVVHKIWPGSPANVPAAHALHSGLSIDGWW